jgi:hypothetical protein
MQALNNQPTPAPLTNISQANATETNQTYSGQGGMPNNMSGLNSTLSGHGNDVSSIDNQNLSSGNLTSGNLTSGNMTSGNLTSGNLTSGNMTSGNMTSGNMTDLNSRNLQTLSQPVSGGHAFNISGFSNMTRLSNINELKHGDVIAIESAAVQNAYIKVLNETCTSVQPNSHCGNITGTVGISNQTLWIIKQGGADSWCLEMFGNPKLFLHLNVTECVQGNQTCGDVNLLVTDTQNCSVDYAVRFLPIAPTPNAINSASGNMTSLSSGSMNNTMSGNASMNSTSSSSLGSQQQSNFVFAIQSPTSANAFLNFDAKDCSQGSSTNMSCGKITTTFAKSVMDVQPTSPMAFVIHIVEEEPVIS